MKRFIVRSLIAAIVTVAVGALPGALMAQTQQASAVLQDQNGTMLGTVSFTQMYDGVLVRADINGLTPGFHGFHIHVSANCDAETGFQSAGGHLNLAEVAGVQTGSDMPAIFPMGHSGDLTNVYATSHGMVATSFIVDKFRVADLIGDGGHSVVVHAEPDNFMNIPDRYGVPLDQMTMDTGDAGARIACGVIQPS